MTARVPQHVEAFEVEVLGDIEAQMRCTKRGGQGAPQGVADALGDPRIGPGEHAPVEAELLLEGAQFGAVGVCEAQQGEIALPATVYRGWRIGVDLLGDSTRDRVCVPTCGEGR